MIINVFSIINDHILMSKLIVKILISLSLVFIVFFIYLGTTNFMVTPKLVEKEFKIEKNQ